jgi:hypothetical protein
MNEKPAVIENSETINTFHVPASVAGEACHLAAVISGDVRLNESFMAVRKRFDLGNQAV